MSEIVERVARAIYAKVETYPKYALGQMNSVLADDIARAAIEALTPATPEMIAVAWKAFRGDRQGQLVGPGPGFVEAIDAALREALR